MFTVVVISLAASVLIVVCVCLAAFFNVAFREPERVALQSGAKGNWRPPLLRGRELLNWAAATARSATMEFLSRRRTAKTATELANELHEGATAAINQDDGPGRQVSCPANCHARIAVTPPEVLGIADYLRKSTPPDELHRIHDRAAANCRQFAAMDRRQSAGEDVRCPLLDDRDACRAFPARPIRCRGWCPAAEAAEDTSSRSIFDQKLVDPHEFESRSHVVVQGAEFGFRSGLKASGLDGSLYELNSALVVALDVPDAAERWAAGSPVFRNCDTCK